VLLVGTLLGCLAVALASGEGRVALAAAAAAALHVLALTGLSGRKALRPLLLPYVCIVAHSIPVLALLVLAVLGMPTSIGGISSSLDAVDYPILATLPPTVIPVMVAAVSIVLRRALRGDNATLLPPVGPQGLTKYLMAGAALLILVWPAGLPEAGWLGYAVRIIASAATFMPYLAGRYLVGTRTGLVAIWILALLVNGVIALLAGGRLLAFFPPTLFVLGAIQGTRGSTRRKVLVFAALLMPTFVLVSGIAGQVRSDLGRGGMELVSERRASDFVEATGRELRAGGAVRLAFAEGVRRLVPWTSVAIPIMTPRPVPYRGFEGFLDEIVNTFQIAAVSGTSRADLIDAGVGTAAARAYGFGVDVGTNVEFGPTADGWSRGGILVVFLFGLCLGVTIWGAERFIRRQLKRNPAGATVLFAVCAKHAADTIALPFLAAVRAIVVFAVSIFVLILGIEALFGTSNRDIVRRG